MEKKNVPHRYPRRVIKPLIGSIAALLLYGNGMVQAGSGVWLQTPGSGDWNTGANWSSATVPNSSTDVATFATSDTRNVTLSTSIAVDSIVFNAGGNAFTISSTASGGSLQFQGAGVTNNSGVVQNFQFGASSSLISSIAFHNNSTAGSNTVYTLNGGTPGASFEGFIIFDGTSNAGSSTIVATAGTGGANGGEIFFQGSSSGGTSTVKVFGNAFLDITGHTLGSVTIGSLEGTGSVNLGANNLTVGGNNASTVFSGVIQDGGEGGTHGSLTKVGSGALSLTGANTYSGNTTVSGGSLFVDGSIVSPQTNVTSGGFLGGTGTIGGNVMNAGMVKPGDAPGTLTVKGSYNQTSAGTLLIQIGGLGAAQHDLLSIGGAATLSGTLQLQQVNGFQFTAVGQKVTFLTATGGVAGAFATVHNPFSTGTMIGAEVIYAPNSVSVQAIQESFTALVAAVATAQPGPSNIPYETQNQAAVAHALDVSLFDPRNAALINHLDHETLDNVLHDLDLLAPEELTSVYQIAISQAEIQIANLRRRLEDVRSGANGFSASGLAMNGSSPGYSGPLGDGGFLQAQGPDGKGGKMALAPSPDNRWGVFVTGTGEWASVGDTSNSRGYNLVNAGFTLGIDYKVTDHFVIGLASGYDYSSADLSNGGRVFVNGGKLGLYGTYFTGKGFYVDAGVQGGYNGYDTHRAAIQGMANGSTDGGELNTFFGTGFEWKKGGLTFGPTADFAYTYLSVGSFDERGSLAPLDFPTQHQESIRSTFGAKASYDWKIGSLIVKPEVRVGWQHEYGDATLGFNSRLTDGASPEFLVHGPTIGRDSLLVSAGFAIQINDRVSTYVYYDGELARTNYESNSVSGGFRVSF